MKRILATICLLLCGCTAETAQTQRFLNAHSKDPYGSGIYLRDPTFPQPAYSTHFLAGGYKDRLCSTDGVTWRPREPSGVFPRDCTMFIQ